MTSSRPLPVPEEFERYSAEVQAAWLERWNDEQKHRHKMDERLTAVAERDQENAWSAHRWGQVIGGLLGALVALVGLAMAYMGHPKAGATVVCFGVASTILAFVFGRSTGQDLYGILKRRPDKDDENKDDKSDGAT